MFTMRSSLRGIGRLKAVPVAVALGAVVLTGCGSSDSGNDSPKADASAAGDSAGFPRTVKTAMGDVKIPSKPKRVVVLDTGELDDVTLLGIDPVGAVPPHFKTEGGFPTYLKGELGGTQDVGPLLEPNLEKIASLKPDLILSSKVRHEKIYDKLSAIAPTVFTETTGGVWKQNLSVHAQALGLESEAAAALKKYETQAAALGAETTIAFGSNRCASAAACLNQRANCSTGVAARSSSARPSARYCVRIAAGSGEAASWSFTRSSCRISGRARGGLPDRAGARDRRTAQACSGAPPGTLWVALSAVRPPQR